MTTDKRGVEEMVRISGQTGVPVIVVGGEVIVGFNQNRLHPHLNPLPSRERKIEVTGLLRAVFR